MRYERRSRSGVIVAECGTDLRAQAEILLKLAAEADAEGDRLHDGSIIAYGWAPLKVRVEDGQLVLCEPDFLHDPNEFVEGVDHTLRVLAAQTRLLNQLKLEGVDAMYNQGLVCQRGALEASHVFLHRRMHVNERASGWYIGLVSRDHKQPPASELEAHFVYTLLKRRPPAMQVLALPDEYLAVFDGDVLEAVLDPQDRQIWP